MKHQLKCWPAFFQVAWVGDKTFEIRKNDRDFKERDEIVLEEFDPNGNKGNGDYTGRSIQAVITYLTDFEQRDGYVVFGWRMTLRAEE